MTKRILGTTAGVLFAAAGLQAQGVGVGVGGGIGGGVGRSGSAAAGALIEQFQQAGTMVSASGGRGFTMVDFKSNQTVAGRPVSGMEERKSNQTLGDGTEISTSENELFFRDSAGRTRREMPSQNRILIVDPVARVTWTLNTSTKTATRIPMPGSGEPAKMGAAIGEAQTVRLTASGYAFSVGEGPSTATVTTGMPVSATMPRRPAGVIPDNMRHEDLGVESLNGVLANRTRDTLTIPQGQIGNNRDINVVNERWYADDLQMLVKTVNSDPRFGQNTYELTNVSRDEPNPALFQIPGDYAVNEVGAGRGDYAPALVKK